MSLETKLLLRGAWAMFCLLAYIATTTILAMYALKNAGNDLHFQRVIAGVLIVNIIAVGSAFTGWMNSTFEFIFDELDK